MTVTDIVLVPGIEATYGDPERTEIAYCIDGDATLTELPNGIAHPIRPGTMWVASPGERFRFRPSVPTRMICVFTSPFDGHETGFAPPS